MAVLYRKYRPQTFAEVVGQKAIVKTLQNQVLLGQVAHAYLFVGSRGVGKTSVARILAKAVNCVERTKSQEPRTKSDAGDACGECKNCLAIQNGNFIDLIEIDAASNTSVENAREIIEHVRFTPAVGNFKVFVIDEAHMLSKQAFNALLKTLEEPPKHAIFILATTEVGKVPATIISRTQRFDFKCLSLEEIEHHLEQVTKTEKIELPEEAVKLIALHSEGGLRDALSLLDKILTLGNKPDFDEVLQLIGITHTVYLEQLFGLIVEGKAKDIPGFLETLVEKGADFTVFSRDFLEYLRKILVLKITGGENSSALSADYQVQAAEFARSLTESEIIFITRLFLRSLKEQTAAPTADLPVLLAAVEAAMRKNSKEATQSSAAGALQSEALAERRNLKPASPKIEISNSNPMVLAEKANSQPANNLETAVNISVDEILLKWPQTVERLKEVNGPLAHLLRSSPVERIDGARVIVSVKYKFHKQNLEHPKNQETVGKIFKEVYGLNLAIGGEVKQDENNKIPTVSGLSDALQVFGGELIE